jgi:hypothetical protein
MEQSTFDVAPAFRVALDQGDEMFHIDISVGNRMAGVTGPKRPCMPGDGDHGALKGGGQEGVGSIGNRCFRDSLQAVGLGVDGRGQEGCIGQVSNRLCSGREPWWGLHPPHGEGEGKANEGLFPSNSGEENTQMGDIAGQQPDAIETIRDVNLGDVDWTKPWVGMQDLG